MKGGKTVMADNPEKPYRESANNPLKGGKKRDYSDSPLNDIFGKSEQEQLEDVYEKIDEQRAEIAEDRASREKEAHLQQVTRNINDAYVQFEDALAKLPKTREVSVATTHLQTAMLWLTKAFEFLERSLAEDRKRRAERKDD